MNSALFLIFLALSIVHLTACLLGKRKLRMISKVFLMPLLALSWIFGSKDASLLVFAGIILGGLGDIGLLWSMKEKSFLLGMLAFFAGNICYLIYICRNYCINPGTIFLVVVPIIYLSGSGLIYLNTRSHIPGKLRFPSFLYMLALSSLSCLCLLALICTPSKGTAVAFAGASSFLISDGILSQAIFIKKDEPPLINFIVMLTYISAQCLLALGWAMG